MRSRMRLAQAGGTRFFFFDFMVPAYALESFSVWNSAGLYLELNSIKFQVMRTISEIIKDAGGASAIAGASNGSISAEAVYKWSKIGIPDRHWPLVMPLAGASADELLLANTIVRSAS